MKMIAKIVGMSKSITDLTTANFSFASIHLNVKKLTPAILIGSLVSLLCGCSYSGQLRAGGKEWAENNPVISRDAGEIVRVRGPKDVSRSCAFGDGCQYNFSLDVEGENGTGMLSFSNAFSSRGEFYLGGAIWEWEGEEVGIHWRSGLTIDEHYALPYYREWLTMLIKEYSGPGGRSEAIRYQYQRALVNWVLGYKQDAYLDIIDVIEKGRPSSIGFFYTDQTFSPYEADAVLAAFYYLDKDYENAYDVIQFVVEQVGEEDHTRNGYYLFRWLIQFDSGDLMSANEELVDICNFSEEPLLSNPGSLEDTTVLFEHIREVGCDGMGVATPFSHLDLRATGQYAEWESVLLKFRVGQTDRPNQLYSRKIIGRQFITELK